MQHENLGDCEIRSISFDMPNIHMKLFSPVNPASYFITFQDVVYFVFETDHIQNVIEGIFSFNNIHDALECAEFKDFVKRRNLLDDLMKQFNNYRIFYILPLTGVDCIILCETIKIVTTL